MNLLRFKTLILVGSVILASCAHCDSNANGEWDVEEQTDTQNADTSDVADLYPSDTTRQQIELTPPA